MSRKCCSPVVCGSLCVVCVLCVCGVCCSSKHCCLPASRAGRFQSRRLSQKSCGWFLSKSQTDVVLVLTGCRSLSRRVSGGRLCGLAGGMCRSRRAGRACAGERHRCRSLLMLSEEVVRCVAVVVVVCRSDNSSRCGQCRVRVVPVVSRSLRTELPLVVPVSRSATGGMCRVRWSSVQSGVCCRRCRELSPLLCVMCCG